MRAAWKLIICLALFLGRCDHFRSCVPFKAECLLVIKCDTKKFLEAPMKCDAKYMFSLTKIIWKCLEFAKANVNCVRFLTNALMHLNFEAVFYQNVRRKMLSRFLQRNLINALYSLNFNGWHSLRIDIWQIWQLRNFYSKAIRGYQCQLFFKLRKFGILCRRLGTWKWRNSRIGANSRRTYEMKMDSIFILSYL